MDIFNLPKSTKVDRVIPKNAFDTYTTAKQRQLFTDLITRITWTHKLSTETVNLEANQVKEIQIFRIELKIDEDVQTILQVIDKSIPYNIVFVVQFEDRVYIATSIKHPHPTNEDNAVIDWTFRTDWFPPSTNKYTLKLRQSIDAVYQDLCAQLSGKTAMATKPLQELVAYNRKVEALEKEVAQLKAQIARSKQFNTKVELNMKLQAAEEELKLFLSDDDV